MRAGADTGAPSAKRIQRRHYADRKTTTTPPSDLSIMYILPSSSRGPARPAKPEEHAGDSESGQIEEEDVVDAELRQLLDLSSLRLRD